MDRFRKFTTLAIVVLLFAHGAEAKTIHRGTGSPGDRTDTDECPQGQYMVGLAGRGGSWIDQIRILCAPYNDNGTFSASGYEGPVRGGNGGGPLQDECSVGGAMSRVQVEYTEGNRQVKELHWVCTNGSAAGGRMAGAYDGNFEWGKGIGADIQSCKAGTAATGAVISSGRHVNSFALICDTITRQVAAPPPAPVMPTQTGPKPGARVIGKTGRAQTEGYSFAGTWTARTNSGGRFEIVLQVGGSRTVTGRFVNLDGASQYDGVIQGTLSTDHRSMTYSYTQPGMNWKGTGSFKLSPDNQRITGPGTGDPDNTSFTWEGSRKGGFVQPK